MSSTNPNFEVPPEMRAFAEKSVAQARQAFDGFIAAARHAAAAAQSTANSAHSGAREVGQLAMQNAERNIASSFDFATKLVRAKDSQEVVALHAAYVKGQMSALTDQARELSQKAAKMGGSSGAGTA